MLPLTDPLEPRVLLASSAVLLGYYTGRADLRGEPDRNITVRIDDQSGAAFSGRLEVFAVALNLTGSVKTDGRFTFRVNRRVGELTIDGSGSGRITAPGTLEGSLSVSGSGQISSGTFRISIADHDDQKGEKRNLLDFNTKQRIESAIDVDVYDVFPTRGARFAFDLRAGGAAGFLRLFDHKGKPLASAFRDTNHPKSDAYLVHDFPKAGHYYVAVSSKANRTYSVVDGAGDKAGGVFDYRLSARQIDEDGRIADARPLGAVTRTRTLTGYVCDNGGVKDIDLYSFDVAPGISLGFESHLVTGYLRLFDAQGRQLAAADRDPDGEFYVQ